jgi:hypothetical protein
MQTTQLIIGAELLEPVDANQDLSLSAFPVYIQ